MLYEDAITIRVIRRIAFQSFCVDFAKRAIRETERRVLQSPFLKQSTLSDRK